MPRLTATPTATPPRSASPGRPVATSHAAIERAAFALFADRGFEGTTMAAIAAEVRVGRRTLFRYYRSKNDIAWGQFDAVLDRFRETLAATPVELPLAESVHRAVLAFNAFDLDAHPTHRERMALILGTPALEAHSVLRYAAWRRVVAEHVAGRLGLDPEDLMPRLVGQVSLALTLTAYGVWLDDPDADLSDLLGRSMTCLRIYLEPARS